MLPFLIPLISAGAGALAQGISSAIASGDEAKARSLLEQAAGQFRDLKVPSYEDLAIQAEQQAPSEMARVAADPGSIAAQRRALQGMMGIAQDKGMDAEMRANLEGARQETARQEQSQRGAILDQASQRGMSGGGMAVMSQLQAQQGAADRNSTFGLNAASEASRRALQALAQGGEMASTMRGQSFGEEAAKAQAQDAINRFNTGLKQDTNVFKSQARDRAFNMEFDKRRGTANALGAQATDASNRADGTRATGAAIGSAAGQAITNAGAYFTDPAKKKKGVI